MITWFKIQVKDSRGKWRDTSEVFTSKSRAEVAIRNLQPGHWRAKPFKVGPSKGRIDCGR